MFAFFPDISKKFARGFLTGGEPFITDFAPLFSQVKYKTSEMKQSYLYNKIFGGACVIFQNVPNVNF